jgi:antitoxin FitA
MSTIHYGTTTGESTRVNPLCRTPMRTTVTLDDDLLRQAQQLTCIPEPTLSLMLSIGERMAQVLIRQLDDQVVATLRARACARGVSLEQSLRDLLTAAAQESESLREDLARLRATTPAAGRSLDVAALIREDRDGH